MAPASRARSTSSRWENAVRITTGAIRCPAIGSAAAMPSSTGIFTSRITRSGRSVLGQLDGPGTVAGLADDVVALLAEHLGEVHADQRLVLGDHDVRRAAAEDGWLIRSGYRARATATPGTSASGGPVGEVVRDLLAFDPTPAARGARGPRVGPARSLLAAAQPVTQRPRFVTSVDRIVVTVAAGRSRPVARGMGTRCLVLPRLPGRTRGDLSRICRSTASSVTAPRSRSRPERRRLACGRTCARPR